MMTNIQMTPPYHFHIVLLSLFDGKVFPNSNQRFDPSNCHDGKKPTIKMCSESSLNIQKDRASNLSNQSLQDPRYRLTTGRDISIEKPSLVIGSSAYFDIEVVLQP
jgi:hypothetical protein